MVAFRLFAFLQLAVQFSCVVSYTVVLKQVKPLHPPVKVYRYELRHPKILTDGSNQYVYHKPVVGQRIYPVVLKPQRDSNFRQRVPAKKEKRKFVLKPTDKPVPRDPPLYGLSQELVPPVSNQIDEYSEAKEEETVNQENDIRPLLTSPHDEKSFASFGQEKGRIYKNPGDWATPPPVNDSENTTNSAFTPSQLYLQIRHKNTVIHVPQSEALKDAETLEELINAPRLKELARTTHVQEVYSEEGYEDAGYDHAGHIRQAQHGEVYNAKDEGKFRIKEPPIILDYDSDLEESKKVPFENKKETISDEGNEKAEPRITRSRTETSKTSIEYTKIPQTYKGEHKYSSRVKNPEKVDDDDTNQFNSTENKELSSVEATFPSYFGEVPPALGNIFMNDSTPTPIPLPKKSSKYRKGEFNSTKIYPVSGTTPTPVQAKEFTDFKPYISMIDSQASPSAKSLKYSRIYSKKTKQLSLQPYQTGKVYEPSTNLEPPRDRTVEEESINQRIVLPTIGYINSLTTAHFGKGAPPSPPEESKTQLTSALNLTEALNYLRSNKSQKNLEPPKLSSVADIRTFEPMKLKKAGPSQIFLQKRKRDVYLVGEREKRSEEEYEGNDEESDSPHNEKNEEIAEDERKRIEEENREKEKYERELREEISDQEKEILRETFRNIGVREDISEVFPEFPSSGFDSGDLTSAGSETTPTPVDLKKYPFYFSHRLPENSPLRYATDPKKFPRKSGHKMEFYESRDEYIQCPDFHPDLEDLPNSNSTEYSDEQAGENQRLAGVGDKIACLKMKYFDREPFDNPIFKEREIDYVGKPKKGRKTQKKVQTRIDLKPLPYVNKPKSKKPQKYLFSINATAFPYQKPPLAKTQQPHSNLKVKPQNVIVLPHPMKLKTNETNSFKQTIQNLSKSHPFYINPTPLPSHARNRIIIPDNCIHKITQLAALDGTKNLIVDCQDATLVQEVINGVVHLRIIPKTRPQKVPDQTDWVPIVGYNIPKQLNHSRIPFSRKTDEVTVSKNDTRQNTSSDHYVIDELKEEDTVRQGEVVEDMDHYMKLMAKTTEKVEEATTDPPKAVNGTRKKREAQRNIINPVEVSSNKKPLGDIDSKTQNSGKNATANLTAPEDSNKTVSSRPFESKRKLTRLSGLDFLVRYHKNKGKPNALEKTSDFWKITTLTPKPSKKSEKPPDTPTQERTATTEPQNLTTAKKSTKPNEPRKISPLNLIPEKITKKPESKKTSEFRKTSTGSPTPETTTPTQIPTKIITKVSRETSESSEKPRIVHVKAEDTSNRSKPKPETPQYQTIKRNKSVPKKEDSEETSRYIESTEGPTLYYIVDLKTGRGKWVTDYEDLRRGEGGKARKTQKGGKRGKRRKKTKF